MVYKLKKEFSICCSHRLNNKNLSIKENKDIFGKCNNLPNHGHNYKIILNLKSNKLDPTTGMVQNFYELKDIFQICIDNKFDHQCLNEFKEFKNLVASAENMCKIFYDILKPHLSQLYKIEIYETEGASAIYEE